MREPFLFVTRGSKQRLGTLQLDGDDNPIEGLYAAGNAGGSFFGYYHPVSGFSAAGVSHALVGGPLAAASALGKTLDDLPKA